MTRLPSALDTRVIVSSVAETFRGSSKELNCDVLSGTLDAVYFRA